MCECDDTSCPVHEGRTCTSDRVVAVVERAYGSRGKRFRMCRSCTKDAVECGSFNIIERFGRRA